jgi:hypothetical protein
MDREVIRSRPNGPPVLRPRSKHALNPLITFAARKLSQITRDPAINVITQPARGWMRGRAGHPRR